eukprot:TRINITY_DN36752_c0_g1_i1.p1 TRINITY_DN36752_c0_g1~~TRINITY_DN36752_c0_g1_i1.p1  ORF type:complete len:411 (+),score=46.46 TRINITY_DN36752_c0_g1_i1:99-1331(+)
MSKLATIPISRSELVLRTARLADVYPVKRAFDLSVFETGVTNMLKKEHRTLSDYASCSYTVGNCNLHIVPVHRNLVQHGNDVSDLINQLRPNKVIMPTGQSRLYDHIVNSVFIKEHCMRSYPTEASLLDAEVQLLERCLQTKTLSQVIDRKILLRSSQGQAVVGLRHRKPFDFNTCHLTHYPFFRAAWAAEVISAEVMWAGIDPFLFEERARSKSLQAEWDRALHQENIFVTHGNDWLRNYVSERSSFLTPQEFLSDLNIRAVIYNIKRLNPFKQGSINCLLVVPASEFHLAVGWASSSERLTTTAYNQAVDPNLDPVPSFKKSVKSPEFTQIERAIHADTFSTSSKSDELALSQDPRLASTPGRHNPFIGSLMRPSASIKTIEVKKEESNTILDMAKEEAAYLKDVEGN